MSDDQPTIELAIAIVNWRTAEYTQGCLESLAHEIGDDERVHVYVVDNGSGDGSDAVIQAAIDRHGWHWATLLCAADNRGFAAGNNVALRKALGDHPDLRYVLLLNPDTIVRPGGIKELVSFLENNPEVGIVGGRSEDEDSTPQACCFGFYNPISEFASNLRLRAFNHLARPFLNQLPIPSEPLQVDWVSGAFVMLRVQVFRDVGLLDEGYFLYFEETDLILRAARAGWSCWHVPAARVVHFVGQSSGVTNRKNRSDRRPSYWYQSRTRYFLLNHGWLYAAGTDLLVVIAHAIWEMRRFIQRKKEDPSPAAYMRDLLRHSVLTGGGRKLAPRQTS